MREYRATVGATDGNIIAAIITTQSPRNQPSAPRPVHGPSSMPRIRSALHHQPTAASTNSAATRASRTRTAAKAGARPPSGAPSRARTLIGQADQANSAVDTPVFPSYEMPKRSEEHTSELQSRQYLV